MSSLCGDINVKIGKTCLYTWTIPNFEKTYENLTPNEFLRSPAFTTDGSKSNLHIRLDVSKMNSYQYEDRIALSVEGFSSYFKYCLENFVKANARIHFPSGERFWNTLDMNNGPKYVGSTQLKLAVNDEGIFSIKCEIIEDVGKETYLDDAIERRLKEFDHFELLLQDDEHSDVILVVDGEQLKAHKCILSKSPVFAAMFTHSMLEKEKNLIEIKDFQMNVIKELLRFMYAGKVGDIEAFASDLYVAADKYSVEGLKVTCEKIMCHNMNTTNVFDFLNFSRFYGMKMLKTSAIQFIAKHQHNMIEI